MLVQPGHFVALSDIERIFSGPFDPFGPWLGLEAHDSALEGFRQRAEKQLRSTENFPEEVLVEDAATMASA